MTNAKVTKIVSLISAVSVFLPAVALAQGGNLLGLLGLIEQIVSRAIPILVGLALIYFIWGLIRYVIGGSEEERENGKKMMWWGIVALFVIVSIWGIVAYIANILGVTQTTTVTPPTVGGLQR